MKRTRTRRLLRCGRRLLIGAVCTVLVLLGAERLLSVMFPYPMDRLQLRHSTQVLAAGGELLRVTAIENHERLLAVDLDEVAPYLLRALVAAEDRRFYEHGGVDLRAVARAVTQNLASGRVVSGASTLTMQVARLIEPRPRSFAGKVAEAFRARQLERLLDKDSILWIYINRVPMGGTLRGFEAAARYWFGKPALELDVVEAATLVAMVPAPSRRAPDRRPELLRQCRDVVLGRMVEAGLSMAEARAGAQRPLGARRHPWPFLAPHACDHLLSRVSQLNGPGAVRSSVHLELQDQVQRLVAESDVADVDGVAVVVLELEGSTCRAMVGSRDYERSQLNAATTRRCAGSTLKPFLYALALDRGVIGPEANVADTPLRYVDYEPANFGGGHFGRLSFADALSTSSNLPAVRLLHAVGPEVFADLLHALALPVDARGVHLDAALGTSSVSALELARAYATLASNPERVGLGREAAEAVLDALRRRPLVPGESRRGDVAWKSGTSSGRRDAWCVGVTDRHVAVVWMGNLDGRSAANLVGVRSAGRLLSDVVALL